MARTKGMLNLSGNLEVNAQAPLDARTIVPTEADLTVASNFPYPYIGLEVYVTGTGKKFRLIDLDTTQSSSWHEVGEGGGSGGGGHTIQDDGTDMPTEGALNFVGMEVSDNDTDGSTDVAEHRLTSAEISEMMGGIPNPTPRYPVIFDERGTEYQVGWYILSNGTRKPVYQKVLTFSSAINLTTNDWNYIYSAPWIGEIDTMAEFELFRTKNTKFDCETVIDGNIIKILPVRNRILDTSGYAIICYTKTTDTPV